MTASEREMKENYEARQALEKNIISGNTVAFVGSGCSICAGYPSWRQFIDTLIENCVGRLDSGIIEGMRNDDDLPAIAQTCKGTLDSTYNQLVANWFHLPPYPPNEHFTNEHRALWRIPFFGLVTTNYDPCLEAAYGSLTSLAANPFMYDNVQMLEKFKQGPSDPYKRNPYIFHLHGMWSSAESCILAWKDYKEAYIKKKQLPQALDGIFNAHPVVFIGFGLRDDDLNDILERLAMIANNWNGPYFALLPYPEKNPLFVRDRLKMKINVTPVFYPMKGKDDHSARQDLIKEIATCFPEVQHDPGIS